MLTGGLDFQDSVRSGGFVVYRRFQRPGQWILMPHALDVGKRLDGTPDFRLDLVRSTDPGVAGYGVLDFRVVPVFDIEAGRKAASDGLVEPGYFSGGWLRLMVREPGETVSSIILPPLRIASNGLGVVRLSTHMTASGISLLKRALLDGSVLVEAWAEMEVQGVSPRLPAVVTLRASDLSKVLAPDLVNGAVSRGRIVSALARPDGLSGLPTNVDRMEAAEAAADRLCALAATHVPSPDKDFAEWWRLDLAAGETRFQWNLDEPAAAVRMHVLRFDPVGLARKAVATVGSTAGSTVGSSGPSDLDRLITHRDLPNFNTGFVSLLVTANLLNTRSKVLSCGVDIEAAANPPHRMNAIRETVEFIPPTDREEIVLRFAPNEEVRYQFQTFVFAQTNSGIKEWRAPRKTQSGGDLRLAVDDFAARFVPVTASPQLLREGIVSVTAQWNGASETVTLSERQPSDAVVLPTQTPEIEFYCGLKGAAHELKVRVPDAPQLFLDLSLFAEYGSHTVDLEIDFAGAPDLLALEVKPEAEPDAASVTLAFTVLKTKRSWTWFAKSPFAPGYRFRPFRVDPPAEPWSAPQSPFVPLRLKASDLSGAAKVADRNS